MEKEKDYRWVQKSGGRVESRGTYFKGAGVFRPEQQPRGG